MVSRRADYEVSSREGYFTAETQRRGEEEKNTEENAEGAEVTLRYPDAAVY